MKGSKRPYEVLFNSLQGISVLRLVVVIMLLGLVSCSGPLESEYTMNGKRIVLKGGNKHNVSQQAGQLTISVDSHNLVITRDYIVVNGEKRPLPDFKSMEIEIEGGNVKISYDTLSASKSASNKQDRKTARKLPEEFVQLSGGDAMAKALYLSDDAKGSPISLLKYAMNLLSSYFDRGIETAEGFSDLDDTIAQITFSARVNGYPIAGVAIATRTARGAAVGVVFDRADNITRSINPLMAKIHQRLSPGRAMPRRGTENLRWYTAVFPDGTGRVKLPEGWRITSSYQGAVEISGSRGESVSLGIAIPVATPEAARNPLTGEIMPGAIVGYPRNPLDAIYEIPPQAAANLGVNFKILRIIEAARVQSVTGGQAAFVLYDASVNGIKRRALSLIDCSPQNAGWWSFYYSTVAAPPERFAQSLPVMMKIWQSWSVNPEVFQRRLQNAMRAMQQTNRMLTEAANNRMKTFDKGLVDWTEVFRGDRAVKDTLTGEMKYTDIGWVTKTVEKLNELEGYNRYKEIPLRDLMVNY